MINTHQPSCAIQLLSTDKSRPIEEVSGVFQSFAHQRLLFTAQRPFPLGSAVSFDYHDALFVGEVLACEPVTPTNWRILVEVQERLNGLESLLRLRQQIWGIESTPARSAGQPSQDPGRVAAGR